MAGILDALFGRVFSKGVELEIRGGLNASTGIISTPDETNDRNDLAVDFFRVLGFGEIHRTASAATSFTGANVWTRMGGTFAVSSLSRGFSRVGDEGAWLQWDGTETVRVLVSAQCAFNAAGAGDAMALGITVNGTIITEGDHGHVVDSATGDAHVSVVGLVELDPGDEVELRILNHTDTSAATVYHFSAIVLALGDPG